MDQLFKKRHGRYMTAGTVKKATNQPHQHTRSGTLPWRLHQNRIPELNVKAELSSLSRSCNRRGTSDGMLKASKRTKFFIRACAREPCICRLGATRRRTVRE